jgi:hypothetical protein
VHTHILEGSFESFIVYTQGEAFDWKTFLYFYEMGDEYPIAAMPQIIKYYDINFESV